MLEMYKPTVFYDINSPFADAVEVIDAFTMELTDNLVLAKAADDCGHRTEHDRIYDIVEQVADRWLPLITDHPELDFETLFFRAPETFKEHMLSEYRPLQFDSDEIAQLYVAIRHACRLVSTPELND